VGAEQFDFRPQVWREEFFKPNFQHFADHEKFQIGDPARLVFKPGYRILAGVPPEQLHLHGELILAPSLPFAEFPHLRPDDVQLLNLVFDALQRNRRGFSALRALLRNLFLHLLAPLWNYSGASLNQGAHMNHLRITHS
jgi:hypothetical protein